MRKDAPLLQLCTKRHERLAVDEDIVLSDRDIGGREALRMRHHVISGKDILLAERTEHPLQKADMTEIGTERPRDDSGIDRKQRPRSGQPTRGKAEIVRSPLRDEIPARGKPAKDISPPAAARRNKADGPLQVFARTGKGGRRFHAVVEHIRIVSLLTKAFGDGEPFDDVADVYVSAKTALHIKNLSQLVSKANEEMNDMMNRMPESVLELRKAFEAAREDGHITRPEWEQLVGKAVELLEGGLNERRTEAIRKFEAVLAKRQKAFGNIDMLTKRMLSSNPSASSRLEGFDILKKRVREDHKKK